MYQKTLYYQNLLKLPINLGCLSVKNLIKEHMTSTIKAYSNLNNLNSKFALIEDIIADKIVLCALNRKSIVDIVYRCVIAFPLANYWNLSPLVVAQNLSEFLLNNTVTSTTSPILRFSVRVVSPGWIDFYMSDRTLAVWLNEVVRWVSQEQGSLEVKDLAEKQEKFWSIQYAHTRCCSLLRLGQQEKLIQIKQSYTEWAIIKPNTIAWIDTQEKFWSIEPTEKYLLSQLLIVVENLSDDSDRVNWVKLAQNLSNVFLDFWADCRIYGEVARKTTDLAVVRLGLVALVQYFLYRILRNKLSVIPLTEI